MGRGPAPGILVAAPVATVVAGTPVVAVVGTLATAVVGTLATAFAGTVVVVEITARPPDRAAR
ncbi:hypothetical protein GCM10010228_76100 [Streptomyces massasporeus]|nr:hypothetical protein GCM10010228_76100 [Streptomyces massasporeus]